MTDFIAFPPPNSLGEAFSESGITGGGGGGGSLSTYTLSQSLDQVVLTPDGGGTVTQVDIATYPSVLALTTKTQNISFASASTIISNNVAVPGNLILDNNVLTTTGTGGNAVLNINNVAVGGGNTANWANFPAVSNVSIPQGTGITIRDNLVFGTGVLSGYYPDATFYPDVFQVGGGTALIPNPINCANNISLYSGVGGTSIASLQGVGIAATVDVNVTAGGELALTALANINLLAPTVTVEGIFNVTGENNTIGNTSVEGGFEVVGATTLGGAVNITGETTINGITAINGGTAISGVASLNGGAAVVGAFGVAGTTSLTGNLTQVGGGITTSGSIAGNLINTSTITDNGAGAITIRPSSKLELVNLSSINGSAYIPGTNTPWYTVTALSDVNMGGYDINNVRTLQSPSAVGNSNMLILSPSGGVSIACPQTLSLTGNAGIFLQSDIKAEANCVFQVNQNLALKGSTITGVSTINGVAYGGSASGWANFPALNNVNLAGSNINNVRTINAEPTQNFSIVNALTATTLQGGSQLNINAVANGANVVVSAGTGGNVSIQSPLVLTASTIVGVSSINGAVYPPVGTAWYLTPAGANVNMNNFNLSNANNVFSQPGDTAFIVGGGLSNSYINYNDNGGANYPANPDANITLATKSINYFGDWINVSTSHFVVRGYLYSGEGLSTNKVTTSSITTNTISTNAITTTNLSATNITSVSSITYTGVGGATNITQTIGFPYKQVYPAGGGGAPFSGGFLPFGATYIYTTIATSFNTNGNTFIPIYGTIPTSGNYGDGNTSAQLPITITDPYHFNLNTLGIYEITIRFSSMDVSLPPTLYKNNGFYLDFGVTSGSSFIPIQTNLIMGMAYYAELSNDSVYITAPLCASFITNEPLAGGYCFRTRPLTYSQNSGTASLGAGYFTLKYLGQPTYNQ